MSDLVRNPEDRFSHNEAQMVGKQNWGQRQIRAANLERLPKPKSLRKHSKNQRTNGPVNTHLISEPSISTKHTVSVYNG